MRHLAGPLALLVLIPALALGCSSPNAEAPESAGPDTASSSRAAAHSRAESGTHTDLAHRGPVAQADPGPDIDTTKLEAAGGVAYFAGGCFWGVEHFMEQIDGVLRVESGYMGGHIDDPSYEQVSSRSSGHLETVRIYFDPDKVVFAVLAKRFFEIHDPTQTDGQGPDIGPEYLSRVFVTGPEQRDATEGLIAKLEARGYEVATTVEAAQTFWIAEDYHQDHYAKAGTQPYCHAPVDRFGD